MPKKRKWAIWRLPIADGSPASWPPLPAEAQPGYPALQQRFAELDAIVMPSFTKHDLAAMRAQRRHRQMQLVVIVGAALTTTFGAVQAAIGDQRWPGIVIAVLALVATAVANQQRQSRPLVTYLNERAKAEELRSLYFAYLSGLYRPDVRSLEADVADVDYRTAAEGRS